MMLIPSEQQPTHTNPQPEAVAFVGIMPPSGRSSRRPRWRAGRPELWALGWLLLLGLGLGLLALGAAAEDGEEQAPAKVDEALYSRQLYVLGTCAAVLYTRPCSQAARYG